MVDRPTKLDISDELVEGLVVHRNLQQNILMTTTDKLKLSLLYHQGVLTSRSAWLGPAGVLLSLVCALTTCDFKDELISKEAWKTVFVIGSGASGLWLLYSLYYALRNICTGFWRGYWGTIEDIVKEMQARTPEVSAIVERTQQLPSMVLGSNSPTQQPIVTSPMSSSTATTSPTV